MFTKSHFGGSFMCKQFLFAVVSIGTLLLTTGCILEQGITALGLTQFLGWLGTVPSILAGG